MQRFDLHMMSMQLRARMDFCFSNGDFKRPVQGRIDLIYMKIQFLKQNVPSKLPAAELKVSSHHRPTSFQSLFLLFSKSVDLLDWLP